MITKFPGFKNIPMKIYRVFNFGLFFALFLSCQKEVKIIEETGKGLEISIGTACGWCGGMDSLYITIDKTYYEYNNLCDDSDFNRDLLTDKNEWNQLITLLDMKEFQGIDINECNICLDGCDTWIFIKSNSESHKIRFGSYNIADIRSIRPFVVKLDSLRLKFRNKE
jgi:hypothetical protein